MKLLWLSRHNPLDSQLAALRQRFGADAEIRQDRDSFRDAADIAARIRADFGSRC